MANWLDKYSDDGDPINSNNVRESTNVTNVSNLLKQDPIVDNLNDYQISYAKNLLKKHNVTVDSTSNILKDLGFNSSAYYNPLTRTINYKNKGTNKEVREAIYFDKIIEEIPHAIQADSLGVIPFLEKIAKEGLQYPGRQVYKTKGTLENEAHTILNKKLLDKMGDGGDIPIKVTDPKDPRLKAYNDSNLLYNVSNRRELQFNKDPFDSRLNEYGEEVDGLAKRLKMNPIAYRQGWDSSNFTEFPFNSPDAEYYLQSDEPYIAKYKKPVQPYVYDPNIPLMPKRKQYTFEEPIPLKTKVNQLGPPLSLNLFTDSGGSYMDPTPTTKAAAASRKPSSASP